MVAPINFGLAVVVLSQGSIHNNIQSTKRVHTHNNIQTVIFTEVLLETFSLIFKLIRSGNI